MAETLDPGGSDLLKNAQREAYRSRMLVIGSTLEKNMDRLNLGPTYFINLQNTNNYQVSSLFTRPNQVDGDMELVLIAKNQHGNIVGDLHSTLGKRREKYEAEEYVEAYLQNQGAGSALEHAHLDLLQMESNRIDKPITWIPKNQNLRRLAQLKSLNISGFSKPESDLYESELKMATDDQERWQALFGPEKKFGVNVNGKRIFLPRNRDVQSWNQLDYITLIVGTESREPLSKVVSPKLSMDLHTERGVIETLIQEIKYF